MAAESVVRMSSASTASSLYNFNGGSSRRPLLINSLRRAAGKATSGRVRSLPSEFFGTLRLSSAQKVSNLNQKQRKVNNFTVFAMAAADGKALPMTFSEEF